MRAKILITNILLLALVFVSLNLLYKSTQSYLNDTDNFLSHGLAQESYRNLNYPLPNSTLNPQTSRVVSQVMPAVVSVFGTKKISQASQRTQRLYLPMFHISVVIPQDTPVQTTQVVAGSGFFVSKDGYIVTNRHVVSDTSASYNIQLADGTKMDANVVYRDPVKDLAIMKVSGNNFSTLSLGDSSQLKIGQTVISIGNAFGQFANTASAGEVAALNKTIVAENEGQPQKLSGIIQTSAQLYPGDSGGPTFDLNGNVVGINVATAVTQYNVSFSIPINDAKTIIQNVVNRAADHPA
jgi:serine protease Do